MESTKSKSKEPPGNAPFLACLASSKTARPCACLHKYCIFFLLFPLLFSPTHRDSQTQKKKKLKIQPFFFLLYFSLFITLSFESPSLSVSLTLMALPCTTGRHLKPNYSFNVFFSYSSGSSFLAICYSCMCSISPEPHF